MKREALLSYCDEENVGTAPCIVWKKKKIRGKQIHAVSFLGLHLHYLRRALCGYVLPETISFGLGMMPATHQTEQ